LPSVRTIALGKEPRPGHRYRFFAECNGSDTRQRYRLCRVSPGTLGKDVISVNRCRNGFFSLSSVLWHSANHFVESPRKSTRQRRLCRRTVCRALFAECDTRQRLCQVFLRLCQVLQTLGKAVDSDSDYNNYKHFQWPGTAENKPKAAAYFRRP
jgi:hypothetical protein